MDAVQGEKAPPGGGERGKGVLEDQLRWKQILLR